MENGSAGASMTDRSGTTAGPDVRISSPPSGISSGAGRMCGMLRGGDDEWMILITGS